MARIKRGVTAHQRHKKVLALTKGHRGSRSKLYRRAHEAMLHALKYAYRHRKELKGDMRRLWIIRIGAGVRAQGLSYSQFMYGLKQANVSVDRKVMAELAINDITAFTELVTVAKAQLAVAA